MFTRQKNTAGVEVNVNLNNVNYFSPASENTTTLSFNNGETLIIDATVRTMRSAVKKAFGGKASAATEETSEA